MLLVSEQWSWSCGNRRGSGRVAAVQDTINRPDGDVESYSRLYIPAKHFVLFWSTMSRYSSRCSLSRRLRPQGLRTRRQGITKRSPVPRHRQVIRRRQDDDTSAVKRMDLLSRKQAKSRFPSTAAHRPLPFPELRHLVPRQDLEAEVNNVCELVGSSLWNALTQVRLLDEQLRVFDTRVQRSRVSGQTQFIHSLVLQRSMLSGVHYLYWQRAQRRVDFLELLMSRLQRQAPGPRSVLVNTGVPSQPITMTFGWTRTVPGPILTRLLSEPPTIPKR